MASIIRTMCKATYQTIGGMMKTTHNIRIGDQVKTTFSDGLFLVLETTDKYIIVDGGLFIELSDVTEVVRC